MRGEPAALCIVWQFFQSGGQYVNLDAFQERDAVDEGFQFHDAALPPSAQYWIQIPRMEKLPDSMSERASKRGSKSRISPPG
jgi:hypothetical protein